MLETYMKVLEAIHELVADSTLAWRNKKETLIGIAKAGEYEADLEEFISWWDEGEAL